MTAVYTTTAYAMWVFDNADVSTYCVLVLFSVRGKCLSHWNTEQMHGAVNGARMRYIFFFCKLQHNSLTTLVRVQTFDCPALSLVLRIHCIALVTVVNVSNRPGPVHWTS